MKGVTVTFLYFLALLGAIFPSLAYEKTRNKVKATKMVCFYVYYLVKVLS